MENYAEILQALADKFGTTVEHLWGVLIKQAAISATVDIVILIILASMFILCFLFVQKKTMKPIQVYGESYKNAEWREENAFAAWLILGIFGLIVLLYGFDSIRGIIAGIFNPEYWALNKIIGKL